MGTNLDYSNNYNQDINLDTRPKKILEKYIEAKNLCDLLDEQECQILANKLLSGFAEDKASQEKWMRDTDEALKLCRLTKEPKNTPLPQSANIKYPMITTAAYQYAARTYPELIQDGRIVKAEIEGQSNPMTDMIAKGISIHMSHQLLGSDVDWEVSMDKLLTVQPTIGFTCKKTYYDTINKKICSDVCYYKDIVLRNDPSIQSINDLRRITHVLHVHPNDLLSNARAGLYDEECVEDILNFYSKNTLNPECTLLECHTFCDLDRDGYEEPYVITLHKETNKIVRIYARYKADDVQYNEKDQVIKIVPTQYFTDYHFLPCPDGSFMSVGFGSLMLHLNETVNTILNQLIDAGSLANLQTGIMDSRIKIQGGQLTVEPGQWTKAKGVIGQQLKDGLVPINYKEPSAVLYQLLGLLLQSAKELTSATDAMQGMQNATNVPATSMLAMIEQGMKLYSSLQRRLYRSLKDEYQKIYRLNGQYLDEEEYMTVLGEDYRHLPNIYKTKAIKVIPIADPNLSSDAQRMTQAQALMSLLQMPNVAAGVNVHEILTRFVTALRVPNVETIIPPEAKQQLNKPDPKMIEVQAKSQAKQQEVQIKGRAQDLKDKEFVAKLSKMEAEINQLNANSVRLISQAKNDSQRVDAENFKTKVEAMKTHMDSTLAQHQHVTGVQQNHIDNQFKAHELLQNQQQLNQSQQQMDQEHVHKVIELKQNQDQIENDQQNAEQQTDQSGQGQDNSSDAQ